jgi:REP element-mobilizing transposase RayT
MPQSLLKVAIHVIFSTKHRKNLIPEGQEEEVWAYIGGIARKTDIVLIIAGGLRDHVHLLFELPATMTIADTVKTFKANSSRWLREKNLDFAWQAGYGAFSVSRRTSLPSSNTLRINANITRRETSKRNSCCC